MTQPTTRKGASRAADIPPDILAALERGELQSATLAECLALNQATLLRAVLPDLAPLRHPAGRSRLPAWHPQAHGRHRRRFVRRAWPRGHRTLPGASIGHRARLGLLHGRHAAGTGPEPAARGHPASGRRPAFRRARMGLDGRGPHLAADLDGSIALLAAWTAAPSERPRRFASEALRPRGVWCAHIAALKKNPARALPLLEPLKADTSAYAGTRWPTGSMTLPRIVPTGSAHRACTGSKANWRPPPAAFAAARCATCNGSNRLSRHRLNATRQHQPGWSLNAFTVQAACGAFRGQHRPSESR
ncbi:hypothetical protein ACU4GD_12565 [Cupriavidus basilensis]